MDVTKAYSIAYKGLKNGRHDFAFDVDGSLFEAFESPEIRDGACRVRVGLTRSETMLRAEVAIEGYVVVACDRCLEDCRVPVAFEGELLVKFSDEIRDYDGEVMWLSPAETEVDLSQYIYESIVLSLPYQRVHPDGECDPAMLERFRIVTDEEFARIERQAAQAEPPIAEEGLSALAELKRRMEADESAKDDSTV